MNFKIEGQIISVGDIKTLNNGAKTISFQVQTNEESKAANILQRYRKKVSGIILFPGPWQQSGYVLQDTLELINLPFVTVSIGEKAQLLQGGKNIEEANLFTGCEKAVSFLA